MPYRSAELDGVVDSFVAMRPQYDVSAGTLGTLR